MIIMAFDTRLIPNYIAALAIIGVFLWGFWFALTNTELLFDTFVVEDSPEETAVRTGVGSAIVTAMIFIVKEVTTYLFRKNPE